MKKKSKVSQKFNGVFNSKSLFLNLVAEEPKKKLTKKELKAIEDAEFEAALAGITPSNEPKEEKK